MAKVTKNLSKIQVNTKDTEYELILPKTDSSGNLENVAYINTTNTFQKPQEFNLESTSNYESTELKGKSTKYDRVSGTFTSGTENTIMLTSLYDKNNKLLADSTLQISGGKTLSYLEVLDKSGSAAALGIAFNSSTNKFETFAPETTEDSPANSIVTKGYLDNFVPSGSGTVSIEDATNSVKGIVLLSDIAGTADAATGHTAVTPKALQDVITAYKQADSDLKNDLEEQIAQGGTNLGYIVTPIITSPTNESTDQSTLTNIIGTAFKSVFDDDTRTTRQFQVATDSAFESVVKDKEVNADSWVIEAPQLSDSTKYYVRIRDKATSGFDSAWSPTVEFTTGQGLRPTDPVITLKGYNNSPTDILSGLTIETSEFEVSGGEDTHKATSWSIATKNRANVWESLNDTEHKTSITVPEGTLQKSTEYVLTVIFHSTSYGDSNPVTKEFTTSSDFGTVNAPTLTVEGAPTNVYETPTLTGGAFSNTRDQDTHEMTDWEIVPTAGGEAVWQSLNNSSNKTTIKVPSAKLQVGTAYTAKVRYKGTKYGWSNWTEEQFTTVSIYAVVSTPTITGPTTEVERFQIFSGSAFTMETGQGSHDVTDWILVKSSEPEVEIWSSKNDSVNKTTCPSLKTVLEISTEYILKVRYHDATNNIWSEYGTLTFTTVDVFYDPTSPKGIHFIAARNVNHEEIFEQVGGVFSWEPGSGVKYFSGTIFYEEDISVYINGELAPSAFDYVEGSTSSRTPTKCYFTFKENDEVLIVIKEFEGSSMSRKGYPLLKKQLNIWKEFLEPLPTMLGITGGMGYTNVYAQTDFSNLFRSCRLLISLPEYFFINNTQITTLAGVFSYTGLSTLPSTLFEQLTKVTSMLSLFAQCDFLLSIPSNLFDFCINVTNLESLFFDCIKITSIPEHLFDNNLKIQTIASAFKSCVALKDIPVDLFKLNSNLQGVSMCFDSCTSAIPVCRFTAPNILFVDGFAFNCKDTGTVYVPADSTSYRTFEKALNDYVNLIEE